MERRDDKAVWQLWGENSKSAWKHPFTHFSSKLFWVISPTDSDFKGALIRYSTGNDPYQATHNDGTFVCDREANLGSSDSFTVKGLENGIKGIIRKPLMSVLHPPQTQLLQLHQPAWKL
jgi:hypothetical protein